MSIQCGDRYIFWFVCERTGRWAAALRVAIARHHSSDRSWIPLARIKEVRTLTQLMGSLLLSRKLPVGDLSEADDVLNSRAESASETPPTPRRPGFLLSNSLPKDHPAIVLVEVGEENLADVLEFFSTQRDQNLRFVALMDDSLGKSAGNTKSIVYDRDFICDALCEAGAADILQTPRQIARLLPLAVRLAQANSCFGKPARDDSIAEMAKLALPWQDD